MKQFNVELHSHTKVFEIAKSSDQYKQINEHIDNLLEVHSDFMLSEFMADLSSIMTLENNAGWDTEEKHRRKTDLLFELQNKYQPKTDRFLS